MPSLMEILPDYIRAAFSGLWIVTHEPDEAERDIFELASMEDWRCVVWDLARGLRGESSLPRADDPVSVLKTATQIAGENETLLVLLHNYHKFVGSAEVLQTLINQLQAGKTQQVFFVVLSPVLQVPVELEKLFVVIEHPLPTQHQLSKLAVDLLGADDLNQITPALLESASGMTCYEAEGAFALSLTRHNALRPEVIWELKAQALKQQNLLSLDRGQENFESLGGLVALKDFCRKALAPGRSVKPRGTLLLSPPGCGKSQFCRALGKEVGRPVLSLDLGSLFGSLVGESERNIRQALKLAEAMAPCILFVDELEKALSGVHGQGDSGVSTRMFGTLLTWLADHQSDVFFIGTANRIDRLPPEFTRAERLDAIFFIDLPGPTQREQIWQLARRQYDIAPSEPTPADDDWTGAEIKACCRLSALLQIPLTEASRLVVPVARTAAESITALREWIGGRCLCAETGAVYLPNRRPATNGKRTRRIEQN
ncbi:AAA family ATPase [Lacunimicrobium album]